MDESLERFWSKVNPEITEMRSLIKKVPTIKDSDVVDTYTVTEERFSLFLSELTENLVNPDIKNPLFDDIWLPWAKRALWINNILCHPRQRDPFSGLGAWTLRTHAVEIFSWAVPTLPVLETMVSFSPHGIAEIGAGTGYWLALLSQMGADVVGVDDFSDARSQEIRLHHPVEHTDGFSFVQQGLAGQKALFFCWPRRLFGASEGFPGWVGDTVFFVGEVDGGCTADIPQALRKAGGWEMVAQKELPRWQGMNDVFYVLKKKSID